MYESSTKYREFVVMMALTIILAPIGLIASIAVLIFSESHRFLFLVIPVAIALPASIIALIIGVKRQKKTIES